DQRALRIAGVRQNWSFDLGSRAVFKFGGTIRHESATYDYSKLYRRERIVNRQVVVKTDSGVTSLAPSGDRTELYVSQRVRPIDPVTVELGVRYDRTAFTGDEIASPRLNASWQLGPSSTLRGSWGRHAQSQSIFGLQVEDGVRAFAPAERATQTVLGLEQ